MMALRFEPIRPPISRDHATADSEVGKLIAGMLQLLPSERLTISDLCTERWVVMDGPLPPDTPLSRSISSGNGFVERADVDGLVRGRVTGSNGGGGADGALRASWRAVPSESPR